MVAERQLSSTYVFGGLSAQVLQQLQQRGDVVHVLVAARIHVHLYTRHRQAGQEVADVQANAETVPVDVHQDSPYSAQIQPIFGTLQIKLRITRDMSHQANSQSLQVGK